MSNTKKVRVVIEGYVPDYFPVKYAATSGGPFPQADFLPLYLHAEERTVKLEWHTTTKVKVLDKPKPKPKPKPDAFLADLNRRLARLEQETWIDATARKYTISGLLLARRVYLSTQSDD
jgi:hypothetical protein